MKIRTIKPLISDWYEIVDTDLDTAIQDHHIETSSQSDRSTDYILPIEKQNNKYIISPFSAERMHLRLYETTDGKRLISRVFSTGMRRRIITKNTQRRCEEKLDAISETIGLSKEEILNILDKEEKYETTNNKIFL